MRSIRNLSIAAPLIAVTLSVRAECCGPVQWLSAFVNPPASWQPTSGRATCNGQRWRCSGAGRPGSDNVSIVGFWHVKFVSDGISTGIPGGVPKGAEVDAGYSQWHSDGTEIMNSGGRAPNTGDFCLGVWAKVGRASTN